MSSALPICPKCGERNEADAQFCGYCGQAMGQIVPAAPAPAPSARGQAPRRTPPRWLLGAAAAAAVAVLAAGGVSALIFSRGKGAKPAPPVQPIPAPIAVDHFELTVISPSATQDGLRIVLKGTFNLSGTSNRVSVQVLPAWRKSGGRMQYGAPLSLTADNGTVPVAGTLSVPRQAPSDSILVYLAVRVGSKEWLSPPGSVAVASVPAPPPPPVARQYPPAQVPPTPQVRTSAPYPPPTPRLSPAPSTETPAAVNLHLTPTSPVQIRQGGTVYFDLSFVLTGGDHVAAENTLAARGARGALVYGRYSPFTAVRGTNVLRHLWLVTNSSFAPGPLPLYGVVQINGKIYRSQSPVVVTIMPAYSSPAPPTEAPPASVSPTSSPSSVSSAGRAIVILGHAGTSYPGDLTGTAVATVTQVLTQNGIQVRTDQDPANPAPTLRLIVSRQSSSRSLNLGPLSMHEVIVRVDAYLSRIDRTVWRGTQTGAATWGAGLSEQAALEKATQEAANKLAMEMPSQ